MSDNQEGVIAKVNGVALTEIPQDLYIPPDALEVFLETFEGPLDLLLYLIRRNNVDILHIPIAEITRQYLIYVELMKELQLELAAEYLVMAAMLAEIKSRLLLPSHEDALEEEDPRAQLIRRLQEYERFKEAAEKLERMPRLGRDFFSIHVAVTHVTMTTEKPSIDLTELLAAFLDILKRSELMATHKVQKESLSVREKMSHVLDRVNRERFIDFQDCFDINEGRMGIVVSFLAVLELLRLGLIDIVQTQLFGPIHVRAVEQQEPIELVVTSVNEEELVEEVNG